MTRARPRRFITTAALLVAGCFCIFSFAQLPRSAHSPSVATFAAPHQTLSCHATQEVSPRGAKLPAHYAVGVTPISLMSPPALTPRTTMRVNPGAIEGWLIHRRTSPPPADNPELV